MLHFNWPPNAGFSYAASVPATPSGLVSCVVTFADSDSPIPVYDLGDIVRIIATFTDPETAALVDPDSVTVEFRAPGEDIDSTTATKDSTGVYHADIDIDLSGDWYGSVVATGNVQSAEPFQFAVQGRALQ